MKIVKGYPPNYAAIKAAFNIETDEVCFAYGDTLYNPSGNPVDLPLMAHEQVHERQQAACGLQAWWDRYIIDAAFRLSQEIPAHIAQYQEARKYIKDRNSLASFRRRLANDLCGPLYGHAISFQDALNALRT